MFLPDDRFTEVFNECDSLLSTDWQSSLLEHKINKETGIFLYKSLLEA